MLVWKKLATAWIILYLGYQALSNQSGGTPNLVCGVVRALGYILSTPLLNLGFLWSLVNRRSRAWHDLLAGTLVVEIEDKPAGARLFSALLSFAALAASAIGKHQQSLRIGIGTPSLTFSPSGQGVDRELRGVVGCPHENVSAVGLRIENAVGDRHSDCVPPEVMVVDADRTVGPNTPIVLEHSQHLLNFLVSTLTMGRPSLRKARRFFPIYSNCRLRSGLDTVAIISMGTARRRDCRPGGDCRMSSRDSHS